MSNTSKRLLSLITFLLILIAASRILRIQSMEMDHDEVWTIWQTFGTPAQILAWTPYDWPPLSYLTVGAWRSVTGIHPFAVHVLPAFISLLGGTLTYRAMRRVGVAAALLAMLAYSSLAFSMYFGLIVRGYIMVLALLPGLLWVAMRYFDRPTLGRALWLGIVLAIMFYTQLSSALGFVMVGLYTLFAYPRRILRWWLPGVIAAVLALPEILSKARLTASRTLATATIKLPPLPEALSNLFQQYAGYWWSVWLILFVIAILALVVLMRRDSGRRGVFAVLVFWVLGMPIVLYFTNPVLGFFYARYAWWLMTGITLLVGWGLSATPRPLQWITGIILTVMLFQDLPLGSYQIPTAPMNANMRWLTEHIEVGDVMILDPNCTTAPLEVWDYYTHAYFPNGLTFVTKPDGYRRVWYVVRQGSQEADLEAAVMRGRIAREYVGPWDFLFRLYEAAPDADGITFANGMRFHGVDIIKDGRPDTTPLVRREAETVQLRLWWSVDQPVPLDYSVSTVITAKATGEVIAAFDGPPQLVPPDDLSQPSDPRETSRWQTGRYYIEERTLPLPYPTANGQYEISMVVYFYADGKPIEAAGVNADGRLPLKTLTVKSW